MVVGCVGRGHAPLRAHLRGAERAVLVWSMGITQHVCGTDNVRAIVESGAGARQRRAAGGGADADPRPLRRPGRRRDGLLRHGPPRRRADHRRVRGGARGAVRLPDPARARAARRPRWSRPPGAGEIDVLWSSGGNFLDTLPDPAAVRGALERVPLRVHVDIVVSSQMLVDRARRCCSCRPRPATSSPAAAPRRPPSGASRSARRSAARASARRAPSGRSSATSRAAWTRRGRGAPRLRGRPGHPRRDRAGRAVLRRHPAPGQDRRRDPVGRRAPVRRLGLPDARRQGALRRRDAARGGPARRAASCSRPAAASSSTRWSGSSATR